MPAPIICITPLLPPAISGVGDYALRLAKQLHRDFDLRTHFMVGDPQWQGPLTLESFPVERVDGHSVASALSLLNQLCPDAAVLLLHYVNYGYAKRGCPVWLIEALEQWRSLNRHRSLVTMFHELYAFGPPWTSSFWLSPLQRELAARLARLSDHCLTSKQGYATALQRWSQGKQVHIPALPVFSSVGEPEQPAPLAARSRHVVVFGSRQSRLRVYQRSLAALEQICQALSIKQIQDIGPPTGLDFSQISSLPIVSLGQKTEAEISHLFLDAIVGFFDYNLEYLAKSTIFATYCAHGLIPVGSFYKTPQADGIQAGKHYWLADRQSQKLDLDRGQAIADHAYSWYHTHRLSIQAKVFAAYLTQKT